MNSKLRIGRMMLAALLCAVMAAGCASGGTDSGNGVSDGTGQGEGVQEQVEIRFPWWGNVSRHERYNAMLDLFEEKHPHIRVIREPASFDDYWSKIATQTAGGNPPDVLMFTRGQFSDYVSRGAVLPLDPYLEDGTIDMSDYSETARNIGLYQDQIYMVTKGMSAPALFVNTDLLERKGAPLPEYEMSWDEFTAYLREIAPLLGTNEQGRQIYPVGDTSGGEGELSAFMRQRGHELFTEDGTELAFEKQDLIDWLTYWQDLREEGIIPPADVWAEEGDLQWEQGPLATQLIAMEFRISNNLINQQVVMEDNIDIVRVPTNPDGVKYGEILSGANIGISSKSRHPEAVAELINFWLNDLEFNQIYNNDHGITGNERLLEEWDLEPSVQKVADHLLDVLDTVEPQGQRPPGQNAIFSQISRSHQEIYFGAKTIEQAVEDIFNEADRILK